MPCSVSQLKPNVYHIADPLGVFMTVIVGEEKALLLDTGYGIGHLGWRRWKQTTRNRTHHEKQYSIHPQTNDT